MIRTLQSLLRRPAFPLLVLLLVAAVVAINATAFGALHALRWKSLPYPDSGALLELRADLQSFGFKLGLTTPLLEGLRERQDVFEGVAGFTTRGTPARDEDGARWRLVRATSELHPLLGVAPRLGRGFSPADFEEGGQVLLLSDHAWRSRFNADPEVLGRRLRLGDQAYSVIGVMPPGFAFPTASSDAWIPLLPNDSERAEDASGNVGWLAVIARTRPEAGVAQAEAVLAAVLESEPSIAGLRQVAGLRADARPWRERLAGEHTRAMVLLQWAAFALLVVVAGNLAILALDRCLSKARELSIRSAVGAQPGELRRLLAAELLIPALPGLILGVLLSGLGLAYLQQRGLMPSQLPMALGFDAASLGGGVLAAILALSLALGVTWLAATRSADGLAVRSSGHGVGRSRVALLIGQLALTTALLGGSGLLLRSAANLLAEDRGFDVGGVVVSAIDPLGVSLGRAYHPEQDQAALMPAVETLIEAVAALPGVQHVALSDMAPFSDWESISTYRTGDGGEEYSARTRAVGSDFFRALGSPLLAGRSFTTADLTEEAPVLVDALFVQRHLEGRDPIGASVAVPSDGEGNYRQAQIIGVVPTMKHERLDEPADLPTIYHPMQSPLPVFWLISRTGSAPAELVRSLREQVATAFPGGELLVNDVLADRVTASLRDRQALLETLGLFAGMTLLLSGLGLYAVLSHAVRREVPTLGLRMALGATAAGIAALVLRRGALLAALGVSLGLLLGLASSGALLQAQLYKLAFSDVPAWSAAALLVALVTLIACLAPAGRAARVQPMVALRSD